MAPRGVVRRSGGNTASASYHGPALHHDSRLRSIIVATSGLPFIIIELCLVYISYCRLILFA